MLETREETLCQHEASRTSYLLYDIWRGTASSFEAAVSTVCDTIKAARVDYEALQVWQTHIACAYTTKTADSEERHTSPVAAHLPEWVTIPLSSISEQAQSTFGELLFEQVRARAWPAKAATEEDELHVGLPKVERSEPSDRVNGGCLC